MTEEPKELFDKYDFSVPPAGCPECGRRVLLIDEDDEIVFCPDDDSNRGCGWSGKICQMDFETRRLRKEMKRHKESVWSVG